MVLLVASVVSILVGPVRRRIREALIGPRLLVHIWKEAVIDGRQRRLIPWRQLVVGLGADPIHRGDPEPRLQGKMRLMRQTWRDPREFFVQPLYPLNEKVSRADSIFAVHLVLYNKSRHIILAEDVGRFTLLIDVPELNVLDWSHGVFEELGWGRSHDPRLTEGPEPTGVTWYDSDRSERVRPGPTLLSVGLRQAVKRVDPQRDVLAVLGQSGDDFTVTVRSKTQSIPLLVKEWPPATWSERLRHPLRTLWRRLIVAKRILPT